MEVAEQDPDFADRLITPGARMRALAGDEAERLLAVGDALADYGWRPLEGLVFQMAQDRQYARAPWR